jgi:hypothetical protein
MLIDPCQSVLIRGFPPAVCQPFPVRDFFSKFRSKPPEFPPAFPRELQSDKWGLGARVWGLGTGDGGQEPGIRGQEPGVRDSNS